MNPMPKQPVIENYDDASALCSRAAVGELRRGDGDQGEKVVWQVPEEVPVALQINSQSFTVMMATPADLRDFAIGFLVSEGIVRSAADLAGVLVLPVENGIAVDVAVPEEKIDSGRLARRAIEGRSGCGLCGVEEIADAVRPLKVVAAPVSPDAAIVLKSARAFAEKQVMNQLNRTVHGAAWVSLKGEIVLVREDVGRHSALDKLIGAMAQQKVDPADGFVLMSSRCSFELVQKAVTAGIGALVTVSAPTALALDLAKTAKLFLAALGGGGIVVFNP
jgi:FdhD protein